MSKLYLFFLYCDFPEIIGTHLVHTTYVHTTVYVDKNVFYCLSLHTVFKYAPCPPNTLPHIQFLHALYYNVFYCEFVHPLDTNR
jgi:hypothetical protein